MILQEFQGCLGFLLWCFFFFCGGVGVWLQVRCKKKININPHSPPACIFSVSSAIPSSPPDLLETGPRRAAAGEKPPPSQPFPRLPAALPGKPDLTGANLPRTAPEPGFFTPKGGVLPFLPFPCLRWPRGCRTPSNPRRGAAALPDPGAWAGQSPPGFLQTRVDGGAGSSGKHRNFTR